VLAMQMLRPENPALAANKVGEFLTSTEPALRRQTSRMLALRADKGSQELLLKLAGDNEAEPGMRADAVAGLAHSAPGSADAQRLLLSLLEKPALRRDALRSLRGATVRPEIVKSLLEWWDKAADDKERKELADQLLLALKSVKTPDVEKRLKSSAELAGTRPTTEADWQKFLQGSGDAAAGEQVFFHANGPRCYTCHRVDGRGGRIGPDLSTIARAMNRDKLIESILTPSKEIAPMFVAWTFTTSDGKVRTGVVVDEGFDSTITIGDAQGKLEVLKRQDIEDRVALPTSLMPDKLHEQMTLGEFLDLLAYLLERK
jgi:putative heme-binding domain-containing protein